MAQRKKTEEQMMQRSGGGIPQQIMDQAPPDAMTLTPVQPMQPMLGMPEMAAGAPVGMQQQMGMDDGRQGAAGLETGAETVYRPRGSAITKETLRKAMRTLHKYRAGKTTVDKRIIEAQEWWKLHNWEQIEARKGVQGSHDSKSNTAWLWNCIVGKHADTMDSYPEPAILPRMRDDEEEARKLSEIVPVVLKINGFEQVYSDVAWQKLLEGTGAYGVFWDSDKLGGMGEIAIRKVNILNLFWEPGVTDLQDSKNVFHVALMDNDTLCQMYPQLKGETLTSPSVVSKYRYDDSISTSDKSLVVDWYYHIYEGKRKVLHYVKFVGEHVLYATVDDPERRDTGLYDDGLYPFVLDVLYPVEGSPCGFGYIHVGKDTQKDIDLISQAVVTNAVVCATPRYFINKAGDVNEEEFADTKKPLVHVSGKLGQDSIMPMNPPTMPGYVVDVLNQKVDELKFVTGNMDVQNGGVPSGVTAASAIAALKEDSGRSSKDSNRASYRAYAQLVTMVIERIRQFYDVPRQFRIVGPRGKASYVDYSNKRIKPQHQGVEFGVDMGYRLPAFDIDVRAQRETGYTKAAQNELAIQLFQLGVFNPQMADQTMILLDMMDFKDKTEIQEKVQQMSNMAGALQQISQIAITMAMQLGDTQAAQMIQQIAMQAGGMAQTGALPSTGTQKPFEMPIADEEKGGTEEKPHPFVQTATRRVEEATRPQ